MTDAAVSTPTLDEMIGQIEDDRIYWDYDPGRAAIYTAILAILRERQKQEADKKDETA